MPNQFGQAYALTVVSPILGGHTHGAAHAMSIRAALNTAGTGADSPLARIPTLHFGRFVVLDDVRNQGVPAKTDHLRSKYLVFVADFDGELAPFLDTLLLHAKDFVASLYQHCVAFPGTSDPPTFRRYIKDCQIESTLAFGAYPNTALAGVLAALDTQRRFVQFLRGAQGAPAAELQSRFQTFAKDLAAARPVAPGTI
jgi:hypothetical protein